MAEGIWKEYRLDIVVPEIIGDACGLRGDKLLDSIQSFSAMNPKLVGRIGIGGGLKVVGSGVTIIQVSLMIAEGENPEEIGKTVFAGICGLIAASVVGGVTLSFLPALALTAVVGGSGAYAGEKLWGAMNKVTYPEHPEIPDNPNPNLWPPILNPGKQKSGYLTSESIPDPLALDLDGNGISFTNQSAYFDLDNNGFAERASWIGKTDGLLALDKNNDGEIGDGSELFGDAMRKKDGTLAKDGFDALTDYDLNKDGKIDAADDVYSKLRVWVDANGDGITDDGELKTLAELGIKQLNLGNTAGNGVVNATAG